MTLDGPAAGGARIVQDEPSPSPSPRGRGQVEPVLEAPEAPEVEEAATAALAGHLVAILFAAAGPLDAEDAAHSLDISLERLHDACALLDRDPPHGLALQRFEGRLQLVTAPASAAAVERFLGSPTPVRLSRAALEALAVIAYRQPVTRGEIDVVRGVNSDSAVATLLARGLITEIGRRETVGRPALLGVTSECVQYLGLRSLADLPPLPDSG